LQKAAKLADQFVASPTRCILFGPFRLIPEQRLLLEGERPVRLGSRAIDILIALAERAGEQVSKRDLMARVWPDTNVVEANLAVHVAGLRRALGDGQSGRRYIVNVPLRGYSFVAPVKVADDLGSPTPRVTATVPLHNLPANVTRLIGRDEDVSKLARELRLHRLLTIVGAAGIGKTAVALAVADELIPDYEHGIWLIDLAPIADPRLVPTALASALRLEIRSDDPLRDLIAAVSDRRMLLMLDNCEHVIDEAAALAAAILRGARDAQILATSREPLRVEGERVRRLSPLASPPLTVRLSAAEALEFAAVQLFVERAAATASEFELNDGNASTVGDICRRLDGLPLAIELAAARVDSFGVTGLAARLDDRIRVLTRGLRGTLPRHRTLAAALDWSYQLLGPEEQTLFRGLAIFAGGFMLEAAQAVAAEPERDFLDIADMIANLVTKSLVQTDAGGPEIRYSLLETMRAYALAELVVSGEADVLARRHAVYFTALFERADAESLLRSPNEWLASYGREIDNLRSALGWAFSPGGDISMGVELTTFSIAMWANLSLTNECRAHLERALESSEGAPREARNEMRLYAALGHSLLLTKGPTPEVAAALSKSLTLAESLGDADYQARTYWTMYSQCFWTANYSAAMVYANKFRQVGAKAGDEADISLGDSMVGAAAHSLGDQALARRHLEGQPAHYAEVARPSDIVRFQYDTRMLGPMVLGPVLWLQGLPDQARRAAQNSIRLARETGHAVSLCNALTEAVWTLQLAGDVTDAELVLAEQTELALRIGLAHLAAYGRGLLGVLHVKIGNVDAGLTLLRAAVDELSSAEGLSHRLPAMLGELAQGLGKVGRVEDGTTAVDDALERCGRSEERWCLPELLRIKGVLLESYDTPSGVGAAQDHLVEAGDLARRQGAQSWELRAAMSLGRLYSAQNRAEDAQELLYSVYAKFTEGFHTADLQGARALLAEWTTL
jgi:predicted ATPase/DNA-binding winged helix-turn-helix (wHTH) protein